MNEYQTYGALEQHLRYVHTVQPLTPEQEGHYLATYAANGNAKRRDQARDALVDAYQPLILNLARRYIGEGYDIELMDLVQEGNLGVFDALLHYHPDLARGAFSTWVYTWIRGRILRALWQAQHLIRLPSRKIRLLRQYDECYPALCIEYGREPTLQELAIALDIPLPEMREIHELYQIHDKVLSLDLPIGSDLQDNTTLAESVPAPITKPDPAKRAFYRAWAKLPTKERMIIALRLGLQDAPMTQQQVASALGVSPRTVELLDRQARRHLEHSLLEAGILEATARIGLLA